MPSLHIFRTGHEDFHSSLIQLYEAWDKPEKAEEWRAKPPQTEAVKEWQTPLFMSLEVLLFIR
jgi:hypothetical protein